jgi:hypothetical protein
MSEKLGHSRRDVIVGSALALGSVGCDRNAASINRCGQRPRDAGPRGRANSDRRNGCVRAT